MNQRWPRWRHRKRLPLRVTLVAAMLGLVTVALVVIGVAGSTLLQRYLLARVDNQLKSTANSVLSGQITRPETIGRISPTGPFYLAIADPDGNCNPLRLVLPKRREATRRSETPDTHGDVGTAAEQPRVFDRLGPRWPTLAGLRCGATHRQRHHRSAA